jgi:fibronectin-binding autotransporter adhesin
VICWKEFVMLWLFAKSSTARMSGPNTCLSNFKNPISMKARVSHHFLQSFCLATGMIGLPLSAASLSWDTDSGTAGNQGGAGTWNLAATNWNGGSNVAWTQTNATTALHTATFGGGVDGAVNAYNITLGTNLAAQTLTFSNTGYRLTAGSATNLTLNNVGNGVISVASGKSASIGNNVSVLLNAASNTGTRMDLTTGGTLDIASGATLSRTGQVTSGFSTTGGTLGFMGSGTINVAGTLSFNVATPVANGGIVLAANSGNSNILNVNGGTVSSNSTINGIALVAAGTSGTLNVTSGLVSTTGTAGVTSGINIANGTGTTGTVNLDGGTISTYQINSNYYNGSNVLTTGGTSTFNFHGGTLRPIANNTAFMGGLTNAWVKSGGAVIDTNGFNVTIAQQLKADTVSLGGGLTKNGTGVLTLTGANTFTGGASITQGSVVLGNNAALGTGTANISGGATVSNSATLSGLTNTFTGSGAFTAGSGQVTISGNWSGFSGTVTSVPTADLVFNGAFSSGVSVTTSENAAYVNNYNLNNTNGMIVQNLTGSTVTYKLGSYASASGSNLRNSGVATGSVNFEIGNLNTSTTVAGTIGGGAMTIELTKVGSGTLTLAGANTYTGATTVSAGTLLVTGSLISTDVSVRGGNLLVNGLIENTAVVVFDGTVSGTGRIAGPVAVADSATLSAGESIESLRTGSLTMDFGATFAYEVANNSSTGADLVAVDGPLNLNGATLSLDSPSLAALASGGWLVGDKITLLSYLDAGPGNTSGFIGYDDDTSYYFGANEWNFDYNDSVAGANYASDAVAGFQNRFVTLTLVPEPSALLLGALGMLPLLRRRR